MGFQDMKPVVHRAASSKGGRVKTDKGLALLTPEDRKRIAVLGGKARHEDQSPKTQISGASGGGKGSPPVLADLYGDVEDDNNNDSWSNTEPEEQQADYTDTPPTLGRQPQG